MTANGCEAGGTPATGSGCILCDPAQAPVAASVAKACDESLATIAEWWSRWPDAGVAIATYADSGVIVLDVDPRHGGDDSLAALEHQYGELPPTWRCLTAGGGLHAYLRHPGGHVGNRVGLWPGLDVRGDGGYVVAPSLSRAWTRLRVGGGVRAARDRARCGACMATTADQQPSRY